MIVVSAGAFPEPSEPGAVDFKIVSGRIGDRCLPSRAFPPAYCVGPYVRGPSLCIEGTQRLTIVTLLEIVNLTTI